MARKRKRRWGIERKAAKRRNRALVKLKRINITGGEKQEERDGGKVTTKQLCRLVACDTCYS